MPRQHHSPPHFHYSPPASARSVCSAGAGSGRLKRSLSRHPENQIILKEAVSERRPLCCEPSGQGCRGWGSRSALVTVWPLLTNSISSWPISTFHWFSSPRPLSRVSLPRDLEEAPCLSQTDFLRPLLFGLAWHSRQPCRCSWHSRSAALRCPEKAERPTSVLLGVPSR